MKAKLKLYCDGKDGYAQFYLELVKIVDDQDMFLGDAEMELAVTEALDAAEVFFFIYVWTRSPLQTQRKLRCRPGPQHPLT